MGQDPCPWSNLKRPLWQCLSPLEWDATNRMLSRNQGRLQTGRWVFSARVNPPEAEKQHPPDEGGLVPSAPGLPQLSSALSTDVVQATGGGGGAQERRFLIFDQSGSRTTMIFSSVSPALQINQSAPFLTSDAFQSEIAGKADGLNRSEDGTASVSQGSKREADDIDALLYSDTEEEEEGNTAPPSLGKVAPEASAAAAAAAITATAAVLVEEEEEVASSWGPSKRRKLCVEKGDEERVLVDAAISATTATQATASTTWCHATSTNMDTDGNDRSSCVNGGPKLAAAAEDQERSHPAKAIAGGGGGGMWKMKRDHIRETVNVLRGIIPGCKGKEACLVLDEAIKYLKSLELKVQALGGTL